jgi:hypothetical protein
LQSLSHASSAFSTVYYTPSLQILLTLSQRALNHCLQLNSIPSTFENLHSCPLNTSHPHILHSNGQHQLQISRLRCFLPDRVQINNTIDATKTVEGGHGIRKYSASARKDLSSAGEIDIMTKNGKQIILVVPKLALVVVSSTFRDYLLAKPDAPSIRISEELLPDSVLDLLRWVNAILRTPNGKFGVQVPKYLWT